MRFRSGQNDSSDGLADMARLAQSPGTEKPDLIRGAAQALLAASEVDRVGVWIDQGEIDSRSPRGWPVFRGVVSDRSGDDAPSDWARLSLEGLPSLEMLTTGRTIEQDLDGTLDQLMLGALLELRRAVWTPVESRGQLRGVVLARTRRKRGTLPVARVEAISAELALAIELEEERRLARQRHADMNATGRLLAELASSGPVDSIFTKLVDGCTETVPGGDGLGAVFAILRTRTETDQKSAPPTNQAPWSLSDRRSSVHFDSHACAARSWKSGDAAWLHAMDSSPLASIWQRAETARDPIVITSSSGLPWPRADVARIVAIPLLASCEPIGTLIAGLRPVPAAHRDVERLELRGQLAASALAHRRCTSQLSLERKRQRAILDIDPVPKIVIEADGRVWALSRGARDLLGQDALEAGKGEKADPSASPRFSSVFELSDQPKVKAWLHRTQAAAPPSHVLNDEVQEARLRTGAAVLLRAIPLDDAPAPGNALAAITLETIATDQPSAHPHRSETQLHNVIEWLEEGVVLFDVNHEIQAMNSRFAQIAGFAPEESSRLTTLSSLISRMSDQAAEPEKFANRWRELARGGDSGVRDEIQLLRPVPRVLERASRPIVSADGERLGRVEIYRDLTAQRVFQSKLLQTEKLAALGQMVTGVAHELSNPLTSILGYAQRLFLRSDVEGQSDEARQIFQEAERAGTILRQLLMTARESRPERRAISLNQIVTRTIDLQKFNLAAEKVTVELELDSSLPGVLGDAGQLQ